MMEQNARWYIVHVHSGSEKRVVALINEQIEKKGMHDRFEELLIPTEEVIEVKGGKKVKVDKKYFPGYVLVKMKLDDDAMHLVRSIPKVSGFLGAKGKPSPVSEGEIKRILNQVKEAMESPRNTITYEMGDQVKVLEGPFASFTGFVEEVEEDKQKLKVSIMIFGRPTPIALEYTQVVKI
ncbi:MAG: transcription termination/antitermination protein NusG [Holosporales bacterium]|jgi:transcriptional antiterminator NusG|nr:transcription termination/antitermination protein NusG [Holosporales bacterium]